MDSSVLTQKTLLFALNVGQDVIVGLDLIGKYFFLNHSRDVDKRYFILL